MRSVIFSILFFVSIISFAQEQKPKLVVGIVVDQMRYDYLVRYWDRFGENGFKKMVTNGFNCKNTHYNYMPTYTAPGHASIFTGTTPENHGIISNSWYDKAIGKDTYCTGDYRCKTVGSLSKNGKMSPQKMVATTISDELKLYTNTKGKVFGISIKDRGAILPAGHKADAAYWFDGDNEGKWITSTFYMNELPNWLTIINNKKPAEQYLIKPWETLYPINTYTQSIADDNSYEELFKSEQKPVFPHDLPTLRASNNNYSLIKSTPFGNTILKELAIELIKNEDLGKDEIIDFLSISFSSTDYIGHQFGPMSVEIEDTYLRLDKDLEELLSFIENSVGKENVLFFLTSDHGAVNVPQYLIDNKIPAGYFNEKKLEKDLISFLGKEFKSDSLIKNVSNYQVFLNNDYIVRYELDATKIGNAIADFLLKQEGVSKAVTATALRNTEFTDRILANAQRGFSQTRSGDVLYILESGWIVWGKHQGTTHGSPYHYDTHVPLLWYGAGIKKGATDREIMITDIAATLAQLLNIQTPSACTGKPIHDLLK